MIRNEQFRRSLTTLLNIMLKLRKDDTWLLLKSEYLSRKNSSSRKEKKTLNKILILLDDFMINKKFIRCLIFDYFILTIVKNNFINLY